MRQVKRVVRALFIRLLFIAYSLTCIWRVTYVSDNKYYWLMMVGVGFLLIETGILLWLRSGKEFRGILPSVLFFLSCVVPSIWILNIDEAHRRSEFQQLAEFQEGKIKEFVHSLDLGLTINPATTTSTTTTTTTETTAGLRAAFSAINLQFLTKNFTTRTNLVSKEKPKPSLKPSERADLGKDVDCCDVQVNYWFQQDVWQLIFIQSLLLILVLSRWLITRTEINVNQRSLILVISVATAADTVNFFCYLNMDLVYRNKYLLYSALLIISLSLLQFVFLHVEENPGLTVEGKLESNENIYESNEKFIENGNMSTKYPLFFNKNQYTKQLRRVAAGDRFRATSLRMLCCCLEQQDPLFFILLAGLFLHDGSYLTFRIFILSKLGWHQILNLDYTFLFFACKNILIIITQIHKVYTVASEKRNKRLYEDYRDLIMAAQNQQHGVNNPYRFAQIYGDIGGTGSPMASKVPMFKSMSTLGSSQQIYFENPPQMFKPALPPALFSHNAHAAQTYSTAQPQTTSITESVLAIMAKDYSAHRQQQDASFYQHPMTPMTTPANPFTSKVGKALYGLPFMNRSKTNFSFANIISGNQAHPVANSGLATPFRAMNHHGMGGVTNKLLKSSKI